MRELIPKASSGQVLSARYLNRLRQGLQRKVAGAAASNASGLSLSHEAQMPLRRHKQYVLKVTKDNGGGTYEIQKRFYDAAARVWKDDATANKLVLDANSLNITFSVDDLVVAYWDKQRAAFVPLSGGVSLDQLGFVRDTEIKTLQKGTIRKAKFGTGPNPGLQQMAQEAGNDIADVYNLGLDGRYCVWNGSLVVVEQVDIGGTTVKAITTSDSATMVRGRATIAIAPGGTGTLYDVVGVDGHYASNYVDTAYLPTNNISVSAGMVVWAQLRPKSGGGCQFEIFSVDTIGGTSGAVTVDYLANSLLSVPTLRNAMVWTPIYADPPDRGKLLLGGKIVVDEGGQFQLAPNVSQVLFDVEVIITATTVGTSIDGNPFSVGWAMFYLTDNGVRNDGSSFHGYGGEKLISKSPTTEHPPVPAHQIGQLGFPFEVGGPFTRFGLYAVLSTNNEVRVTHYGMMFKDHGIRSTILDRPLFYNTLTFAGLG